MNWYFDKEKMGLNLNKNVSVEKGGGCDERETDYLSKRMENVKMLYRIKENYNKYILLKELENKKIPNEMKLWKIEKSVVPSAYKIMNGGLLDDWNRENEM